MKNKPICSMCDYVMEPESDLYFIALSGISHGRIREYIVCRPCYEKFINKLIDYRENKSFIKNKNRGYGDCF